MTSNRVTKLDLGIFLISFSVLLTELLLTRIFSVTLRYHLSFMVVSLAMLGLAAGGAVLGMKRPWFAGQDLATLLATCAFALGVTTFGAVGLSFVLPVEIDMSVSYWLRVTIIYLACAVPFFCGGLAVALILTLLPERSSRYYAWDLAGAAIACIAFIPATNLLGAPSAVLFSAIAACLASVVLIRGSSTKLFKLSVAAIGFFALLMAANGLKPVYDPVFIRGALRQPMLAVRWNSFSRVDVAGTPKSLWTPRPPVFSGFSATLDPEFVIPEVKLLCDANASSQITYFDGDLRRLEYLRFDVSSAAYQLHPHHDVLIIGPGGGRNILMALSMGSAAVTGVEVNPITIDLMRKRFRTFSGGLYDSFPGVRIVNDDGRAFLRRDDHRYDLIEASLVDTWAASAAGAYALTENALYTVEAFEEYLDHLTPDGIVCFNRWFGEPPVETLRLVNLAREALKARGTADAAAHVIVVRNAPSDASDGSLASVLVKRSPFTPREIGTVQRFAGEMGFIVAYSPGSPNVASHPEGQPELRELLGADAATMIGGYPFDISAVHDDRPFFFNRTPLISWLRTRLGLPAKRIETGRLGAGGQSLLVSIVVSALATIVVFFLGLRARSDLAIADSRDPPAVRRLGWTIYFASLGTGFIMVEVVLIQRFNLFLGYPAYSLSVVLFTLLITSAIGSALFGRLRARPGLIASLSLLVALLLVYASMLVPTLGALGSAPLWTRMVLTAALIAPLGLLMGAPFPLGVKWAGRESSSSVAWAWAVNGAASVLGSTLAMLVAMSGGFRSALSVGAAAYALAAAVLILLLRVPVYESGDAQRTRADVA